MKKRQGRSEILFVKENFGQAVGRRPDQLGVRKLAQHALKTGARGGRAVERAIGLTHVEKRGWPIGRVWVETEKFFVFRNRQIVKLAAEKGIGVDELSL